MGNNKIKEVLSHLTGIPAQGLEITAVDVDGLTNATVYTYIDTNGEPDLVAGYGPEQYVSIKFSSQHPFKQNTDTGQADDESYALKA